MSNTQSNSSNNTKTVLYYGKEIQVPNDAKWIHTDSDGMVYTTSGPATTGDNFYLTSEARTVHSFNHTEMSTINWMLSQKRIQDLPSVSSRIEHKAHPHADLMLKYAQIAQYSDKPWEELQFKGFDGTWLNCTHQPQFKPERQYRLRLQQVQIQVGQVWESSKSKVKFRVGGGRKTHSGSINIIILILDLDEGLFIPYEVTEDTLRKHFTLVK